jgi:cyclophilin family peptidyl-prolyl cis-trans isomerase
VPFINDSPELLGRYRVALETTMGAVELEMLADVAPETVRQFLRLTEAGVYDDTLVHRVAPGFVIQTGALAFRRTPLTASQQALVRDLKLEFSDTPNVPGVVSMARGEDPASASTSFFICIGECRSLDGKYTVFARVTSGMEVVTGMASVALDGEAPREPIAIVTARVRRPQGAGADRGQGDGSRLRKQAPSP